MDQKKIISVRDQLIEEGIRSAQAHEKREYRREGCISGFSICRNLETDEDFDAVLALRQNEEKKLADKISRGNVNSEDYWRYRCATVQIEFIHERLKVLWNTYGMSETQSARAIMHVDRVLKGRSNNFDLKM